MVIHRKKKITNDIYRKSNSGKRNGSTYFLLVNVSSTKKDPIHPSYLMLMGLMKRGFCRDEKCVFCLFTTSVFSLENVFSCVLSKKLGPGESRNFRFYNF